jgi:hypothetical protein
MVVIGEAVGEQLFQSCPDEYLEFPQEWELKRIHLYGYVSMALQLLPFIESDALHPNIRQVVISERGMKARIVTPVESCVAYVSMFLNSGLISVLETDPRMSPSVDTIQRCESFGLPRLGEVYRSADLSRATDLMPHRLCAALARGISKGLGFSPFLTCAMSLCSGKFWLHLRDGPPVLVTAGTLMGVGTSWPLLSLYNLWCWESAWKVTPYRDVALRNRVRIVGDDLGGLAPRVVSDEYTRLLESSGAKTSYGKDFVSSQGLVMVEEIFTFCEDSFRRLMTVSTRGDPAIVTR